MAVVFAVMQAVMLEKCPAPQAGTYVIHRPDDFATCKNTMLLGGHIFLVARNKRLNTDKGNQ